MPRTAERANTPAPGGATLDFERQPWAMADALRGHMDAAEYKHVVLGLIFLKYISDADRHLDDALVARFGCPVNLLTGNMIRNPYFRQAVEAARQPIYDEQNAPAAA